MSDKKEEKQIVYPIHEMDVRGKLILPENVITQINYLHGKVGKEEWSGMLVYDVKSGSPAKPEGFVLEAKHIFLMDIGSAAYTEYETDADIVDIYDNIPDAMEWKTGHIHTHHSMSAYFSATDESELNDNVDKHNYYLSLIVNFDGKYTAKVAFLSDVHKSAKMNYVDDAGKTQHFKTQHIEKQMVTIGMDIFYGLDDKFFYDRYQQVIDKAIQKEKELAEARKNKYKSINSINTKDTDLSKYRGNNDSFRMEYGSEGELLNPPANGKSRFEGDPKKMETKEVEDLARNVFAVNGDLDELQSVYQILYAIAASSDEKQEFYYDYLALNVENIIGKFFDQDLEVDEMQIVVDEISKSTLRFSTIPALVDVVKGITEVLAHFLMDFELQASGEADQETIESKLEKEAAELV